MLELVPERSCGSCTVCCTHLTISSPEIQKPLGIDCKYCVLGKGCGIYETRPQVCQVYFCLWRFRADLGDTWRPDRSGIRFHILGDHAVVWFSSIGFLPARAQPTTPNRSRPGWSWRWTPAFASRRRRSYFTRRTNKSVPSSGVAIGHAGRRTGTSWFFPL